MECPECQQTEREVKAGRSEYGSQRYQCGKRYTPEAKVQGYSDAVRLQAVGLYVDGGNLRRIARQLGVNHQSVANWVRDHVAQLPAAPMPETVETLEMDELHSFIEQKKTKSTSSPS
jgi:transposase-like protein